MSISVTEVTGWGQACGLRRLPQRISLLQDTAQKKQKESLLDNFANPNDWYRFCLEHSIADALHQTCSRLTLHSLVLLR